MIPNDAAAGNDATVTTMSSSFDTGKYHDKPFLSVQLLRRVNHHEVKQFTARVPRRLRKAAQEAKAGVLRQEKERCPKKLVLSLSEISFWRPEGLLKAPLGDPSEE